MDWPVSSEGGREAGGRQPGLERGKLGPRDSIPYQTAKRLPVANQVFLGPVWLTSVGRVIARDQLSREDTRHTRCAPRKPSGWDQGGDEMHCTWGKRAYQTPGHLSCSDLGRAQNTGPTESAPLRTTRVPEPERLSPGRRMQPRAARGRFPAEQPRA